MATTWLNNELPADLCASEPRLLRYGFYRRLNDGRIEFVPFCPSSDPNKARAKDFIGVHKTDFNRVLDELLPRTN